MYLSDTPLPQFQILLCERLHEDRAGLRHHGFRKGGESSPRSPPPSWLTNGKPRAQPHSIIGAMRSDALMNLADSSGKRPPCPQYALSSPGLPA